MGGSRTWWKRGIAAVAVVTAVPLAVTVAPAHAAATTTVALWSMDEPAGSAVLIDSSPARRHGTIGPDVELGVQVDGATAHRFPPVPTAQPPTHPGHLDRVPSSAALNPETSDYAVTVRYRTTRSFGNIVQKGQNGTAGGYWKFEAPNGIVTCLFKSDTGQRAIGSINALDDGQWHTVRCELTSTNLTMYVDGVRVSRLAGHPGRISNSREVTIAGKGVCDQIEVTCDYFVGDIDYVRIEKGSGGPANVAPTATMEPSCVGLICSFSAAGSGDVDGAIQRYAWDFGDGSTAQYASTTHTYATAGTYTVSLTVTDDRGATATATQTVTVEPAAEIISFVGQATASSNATSHTVTVPADVQPGDGLLMILANNNTASVAQITGIGGWIPLDSVSGGYATTRVWRKVAAAGDGGSPVRLTMSKQTKASLVVLAYRGTSPGDPVAGFGKVADTVSSISRTTPMVAVRDSSSWAVSYWMHGDSSTNSLTPPEGAVARASATQTGGGRVVTLVADSAASVPAGSYGGLTVTAPTASSTSSVWTIVLAPDRGPVENQPPTATSTSSCADLTCTFDAAGTADADGVVQSLAWDFGDGGAASGSVASHTYASAGTYTVTLTATDDDGATGTATSTVTVPHVAPVDVIGFVGSATQSVAGTSVSVTVPAGVQPGDGMILLLAMNSTTTVSAPAGVTGWQSLGTVTSGSQRSRAWRKVAVDGDAGSTVSFSFGATAKAAVHVLAYRGTNTSDPVAAFESAILTDNSASRATPVATVTGDQSWAISFWAHRDSITGSLGVPAGATDRGSATQTGNNRVTTLAADSAGLVPSGSYGGLTATATAASTSATTMTIVLAPAPPPTPS